MLVPHGTLVLAVDGGRMQLLRNRGHDGRPELDVIATDELDNPATHVIGREGPGRAFESGGGARHSYAAPDLHQRREDKFGKDALATLCRKAENGVPVVLIAPPHMLGVLRSARGDRLRDQLLAEVDKDLADRNPLEIALFLQNLKP